MRKYPLSLAEENIHSKETMLRTGNKSSMLGIMKEKADLDDWPTEIDEGEITSSVVIDVMWYIRSRPPLHNEENENYARRILNNIISTYPSQNIHLVADTYDGLYGIQDSNSRYVNLKEASGCRQRRKESLREFEMRKGLILRNFDEILCNSTSKANLLAFVFVVWTESSDILHSGTHPFLSGGFKNRMEMKMVSSASNVEYNISYVMRRNTC